MCLYCLCGHSVIGQSKKISISNLVYSLALPLSRLEKMRLVDKIIELLWVVVKDPYKEPRFLWARKLLKKFVARKNTEL